MKQIEVMQPYIERISIRRMGDRVSELERDREKYGQKMGSPIEDEDEKEEIGSHSKNE